MHLILTASWQNLSCWCLYCTWHLLYNIKQNHTSMTWLCCFWYTWKLSHCKIISDTILWYAGYWWQSRQAIWTKCHCANVGHLLCYCSLKVTEILFQFAQLISGPRCNMNKVCKSSPNNFPCPNVIFWPTFEWNQCGWKGYLRVTFFIGHEEPR